MTLRLREATVADAPLLRRWDEEPHVIAGKGTEDWRWESELAREAPEREPLIAELSGRPMGFMQVLNPSLDPTRYFGDGVPSGVRALDIWVGEPDLIGQGLGTQIMKLALERCFAHPEVTQVWVDPLADNLRAHRFYRRLGFELIEHQQIGEDACALHALTRARWDTRST